AAATRSRSSCPAIACWAAAAARAATRAAAACRPSASSSPSRASRFLSHGALWTGVPPSSGLEDCGPMGYGVAMRVLITRPEREATALAPALAERGHQAVLAPLFRLQALDPAADFAQPLAASQAVLVTSANGARALAKASEQRAKPVLAVGDT